MALVLQIIDKIFLFYTLMIFARILSSWFPDFQQHPIMVWIGEVTEPYLALFRRLIPPLGMFDISPIVALFALRFIEYFVKSALITLFR